MKNVAIICDGQELSFGINLYHLMHYKDKNTEQNSHKCLGKEVEMYSVATFNHSSISKDTFCIFIGSCKKPELEKTPDYDHYGMKIWHNGLNVIAQVTNHNLNQAEYDEFLSFANKERNSYIKNENEFYLSISGKDDKWIPGEFIALKQAVGLFNKKRNNRIQQMYDCIGFVIYNEFLNNKQEG